MTSDVYYSKGSKVTVTFTADKEPDEDKWSGSYKQGTETKTFTGSGTSFDVELTAEASYSDFTVSGKGANGVEAEVDDSVGDISIVIDRTAPTVNKGAITPEKVKTQGGFDCYNKPVTIKFTLSEAIPEAARNKWSVKCKKGNKDTDLSIENWDSDGKGFSVKLDESGKYTAFTVKGEDAAENPVTKEFANAIKLNVDLSKPSISDVSLKPFDTIGGIYIGYMLKVQFTVNDDNEIESVKYIVSKTDETPGEDAAWKTVNPLEGNRYSFDVEPPEKGYLFIKAVDELENEAVENYSLILEKNVPVVTANLIDNALAKKEHVFEVTANDQASEDVISAGLKRIYYKVDGSSEEQEVKAFSNPEETFDYSGNITIQCDHGKHTVTFVAEDFAGNKTEAEAITAYFDKEAPKTTITPDNQFVKDINDKVVTKDGKITISVADTTIGGEAAHGVFAKITVKKDGSDLNTVELNDDSVNSISKQYSLSELGIADGAEGDGNYEIKVAAHDGAGNKAEEKTYKFAVDRTAPAYKCELVNADAGTVIGDTRTFNKESFNSIDKVIVRFSVADEHMTSKEWTYSYKVNGSAVSGTIKKDDWTVKNGNYEYTLEFKEEDEGLYTDFALKGKDAVGNDAVDVTAEPVKFIISTQIPTVKLEMAATNTDDPETDEDDSLYHNNGGFTVTISDEAYGSQITKYSINISADGGEPFAIKEGEGEFGTSYDVTVSNQDLLDKLGDTESELTVTVTASSYTQNTTKKYTAGAGIKLSNGDVTEGKYYFDTIAPKLTGVASDAGGEEFFDGEDGFYYVSSNKVTDTYTISDTYPGITTVEYFKDEETEDNKVTEKTTGKKLEVTLEGEDNKFFKFKVSGKDLAGNPIELDPNYTSDPANVNAAAATADGINLANGKVLDTVAPELVSISSDAGGKTFYDGKDGLYYVSAGKVTDTYTISDTNLGKSKVSYQKDGLDAKVVEGEKTVVVTLEGEGKYTEFKIAGTDKAGNAIKIADDFVSDPENVNAVEAGEESIALTSGKVLDTTSPTVVFEATKRTDPDTLEGVRRYYNTDFNGTFTVTDNYTLLAGNIGAAVSKATEKEENEHYNTHADDDFDVDKPEVIVGDGNQAETIVYSKDIKADGNYRFYIQGYDKAHNPIVIGSGQPTGEMGLKAYKNGFISNDKIRDTVAPSAVLSVLNGDNAFYKLEMTAANYKLDPYDPYQKKIESKVKMETKDKSPVYFIYDIDSTVEAGKESGISKNYANDANSVTVIPAREQIITIRNLIVKDRAGNLLALDGKTKTLPASNKLVFDSTTPTTKPRDIIAPSATIKATSSVTHRNADGRDLFNHAVTLNVTITDPGSTERSSGLKDVSYDVYVDGKKVKGDSASYGINGASDAINETTADVKDDKLTYTKKFTINLPTSYQSNDIEIRVNATDHSGNKMGTVKYRCGIDTVGPKITVSYDNNSAQNEKYFKADRTATIKVVDRNVDNGKIHINTQVSVPGSFSYSSGGGNGANDTWIKKLYYNKDGDYTLDLPNCTDALGNKATVTYEGTAPKAFTIDKTIPVIYVTFDNNSSQNGKYYKDPRTATVRIHEHNFRASDVKINQTATIQKGSVSAPGVSGFGGGGDDHSASINYSNDGNYTIEVNYTDLAGNPAKVVKVDEFVIDRTKPVVKFVTPDKNNMVFQDAIAPQIEYSDINTTRGMASINLKGMKKSNVLEVVEDTFSNYEGTVRFENLKKVRENDDIYLATAVVTDLAGNEESVSITFSVNRFGSTYDYNNDPFTTDLVQNYFANEEGDVVLREINVNKLTERSLTLYKDGDNRKLVEGTDFKVDENTVNGHYEYIYTIFKANFEEEGNYNIIATSKDEAKNTNSNSSVKGNDGSNEVPLRFAIDKTEPTNEVTGVDITKNKFTESEITLDIRPLDNMNAVAKFLVRVLDKDGNELAKFEMSGEELAKYLEEHDGVYQLTVEQNTGWQTIEIVTTDAAGNQSTDYTIADNTAYNVLVTPNLFVQYINRLPLVLLTVAAVAGIIFFIIWKRKKDQEDETAA